MAVIRPTGASGSRPRGGGWLQQHIARTTGGGSKGAKAIAASATRLPPHLVNPFRTSRVVVKRSAGAAKQTGRPY